MRGSSVSCCFFFFLFFSHFIVLCDQTTVRAQLHTDVTVPYGTSMVPHLHAPRNAPRMHSFTYGNCITVGLILSSTNTALGDGGGFVRTKPKSKGSYQRVGEGAETRWSRKLPYLP